MDYQAFKPVSPVSLLLWAVLQTSKQRLQGNRFLLCVTIHGPELDLTSELYAPKPGKGTTK